MRYLVLLCLLSGCSLIKINEASQPPKHRLAYIGVTDVTDGKEVATRIRKDQILMYYGDESCRIELKDRILTTTASCNDIDGVLNQ